ncbi:MAG: biotin/lipoate A/B protein ligase family protein [Halodesulfurarchaeum sp.]
MTEGQGERRHRDWRLIREESRPGPETMALDEVAARTAATGGPRTVRVYQWSPSCLSLGYSQDPATIDWETIESSGIDVTRRQTGGGAIYHDEVGDISYSVIAPADEFPGALLDAYHRICEPIFEAFDRLGVDATYVPEERPGLYEPACYLRPLHPAHDIVADGRKISGNAQYRQRDAVIQHGSISFTVDGAAHLRPFVDPPSPAAFRDRVVGLTELVDVDRGTAVEILETTLSEWAGATAGSWRPAEVEAATRLADTKYRATDWIRAGTDPT